MSDNHDVDYLRAKTGIKSWLITIDHKRLGLMYLGSVLFFFLVGGLAALAVRTELFTNTETIMSAQQYNEMFTMHGVIMVFLVIIPSIPAALGNFVLPLQLGAKDVAFPRLNLLAITSTSRVPCLVSTRCLVMVLTPDGLSTPLTPLNRVARLFQ